MRFVRLPMHSAGRMLQLADVLAAIPDNDWTRYVIDFWGTGLTPFGMPMTGFEDRARTEPGGFPLSWSGLRELAGSLSQTVECLIIAPKDGESVDVVGLLGDQFDACRVVIRALDSTEWAVGVDTSVEGHREISRAWQALGRATY